MAWCAATEIPSPVPYTHRQGGALEVAVQRAQDGLVRDHAHALPLPLDLDDDRLQALDDVQVRLAARVPAGSRSLEFQC